MEHPFFEHLDTFGVGLDLWAEESDLLRAIRNRSYPGIRAALDKAEKPFAVEEGVRLCSAAIESGCTGRTVEKLLDACPPAEVFFTETDSWGDRWYEVLEKEAVIADRGDVLRLLMARDTSEEPISADVMYAALSQGSVACVHTLASLPEMDWAATDLLQSVWGLLGMKANVDLCLRRVAPLLTGIPFCEKGEIPLPNFVTPKMAICQENWPLVERICRENPPVEQDCAEAVRSLMGHSDKLEQAELARLLDCLLTACPGVLRRHYPRYALAAVMTTCGEEGERLRPHLQRMPGKRIPMIPEGALEPCIHWNGEKGMLTNWDRVLGQEYYPVIRRDRGFSGNFFWEGESQWERDRDLAELLRRCKIEKQPKPGRISELAKTVLSNASPSLLGQLMEEGTVLQGEDMAAMLEWCTARYLPNNRAALLAYGGKEVDYEL